MAARPSVGKRLSSTPRPESTGQIAGIVMATGLFEILQ